MFGGKSEMIRFDRLQSGSVQDSFRWTNDVYEFDFEKGNEKGK